MPWSAMDANPASPFGFVGVFLFFDVRVTSIDFPRPVLTFHLSNDDDGSDDDDDATEANPIPPCDRVDLCW